MCRREFTDSPVGLEPTLALDDHISINITSQADKDFAEKLSRLILEGRI